MGSSTLLSALVCTHFHDDDEEAKLMEFVLSLEGPQELGSHIMSLKDEGNVLFKNGRLTDAYACYEKAIKLLAFGLSLLNEDNDCFHDLALTLNLNLAACVLKMHDYGKTKEICSLVLHFDPSNPKALYRRALASIELGLLHEAHSDLRKVVEIEPKNHDILRALERVTNMLSLYSKGKRRFEGTMEIEQDIKGKRVLVEEGESSSFVDSKGDQSCVLNLSSIPAQREEMTKDLGAKEAKFLHDTSESSTIDVQEETYDCQEQCSSNSLKNYLAKPNIRFDNRKRRGSFLHMSPNLYNKFVRGKTVSFFNRSQLSVMTIRIVDTPKHASMETVPFVKSKEPSSSATISCITEDLWHRAQSDIMMEENVSIQSEDSREESVTSNLSPKQHPLCFKSKSRTPTHQSKVARASKSVIRNSKVHGRKARGVCMKKSNHVYISNRSYVCRIYAGTKRKCIMSYLEDGYILPRKKIAFSASPSSTNVVCESVSKDMESCT